MSTLSSVQREAMHNGQTTRIRVNVANFCG